MILDSTSAPGDLLPGEHDLAEQLGITRPTVREAIRQLERRGLWQESTLTTLSAK